MQCAFITSRTFHSGTNDYATKVIYTFCKVNGISVLKLLCAVIFKSLEEQHLI